MRIVLDTNVLLQALAIRNPLRVVFDAFVLEKFQLVVSTEILLEYEELLLRKHPLLVATELYKLIAEAPNIIFQRVYFNWRVPYADPDDQKFVDAYMAGHADYLVSNDRYLAGLGAAGFPEVRVLAAGAFLGLLAG